jgi:hypothetical protein
MQPIMVLGSAASTAGLLWFGLAGLSPANHAHLVTLFCSCRTCFLPQPIMVLGSTASTAGLV